MRQFLSKPFVQHLLFWAVYLLFTSISDLPFYPDVLALYRTNLLTTLPVVPLVYFNLYVLVPHLLLKRRYVAYLTTISALLLAFVSITVQVYDFVFAEYYGALEKAAFFTAPEGITVIFSSVLLLMFITMALYFMQQWYVKDRLMQELRQKHLEVELQALRHQIQPHFLFNALNTIYMTINYNPAKAQTILMQFSEILSHQLYEARQDCIPLRKELHYLENYLQIEAVRNEDLLDLHYRLPKVAEGLCIVPMLLIPLVENAFKHSKSARGYWVRMEIEVREETLEMRLVNSVNQEKGAKYRSPGGIGLRNVRRRLQLIYPHRHELRFAESPEQFEVFLKIPLTVRDERGGTPAAASEFEQLEQMP